MSSLSSRPTPSFIIMPPGVTDMLDLLQSDDFNQRVKELAYQKLADSYGIDRQHADLLCKQKICLL